MNDGFDEEKGVIQLNNDDAAIIFHSDSIQIVTPNSMDSSGPDVNNPHVGLAIAVYLRFYDQSQVGWIEELTQWFVKNGARLWRKMHSESEVGGEIEVEEKRVVH